MIERFLNAQSLLHLGIRRNDTSLPNTAIEELPEFVFNEAGDVTVALPLTGHEAFQMASDDSIHGIVFRISGPVLGIDGHEGIAECTPRRNASNNGISEIQGAAS